MNAKKGTTAKEAKRSRAKAKQDRAKKAKAHKKKTKHFPKERFTYDAESDTYTCPAGHTLTPRWKTRTETRKNVQYSGAPCESCPLKPKCTSRTKRLITRTLPKAEEEALEASRQVMEHPKAIEAYASRAGMVEPVFAEMRQLGLSRFARKGLKGASLEFAIRSIAHNLRRFVGLLTAALLGLLALLERLSARAGSGRADSRSWCLPSGKLVLA